MPNAINSCHKLCSTRFDGGLCAAHNWTTPTTRARQATKPPSHQPNHPLDHLSLWLRNCNHVRVSSLLFSFWLFPFFPSVSVSFLFYFYFFWRLDILAYFKRNKQKNSSAFVGQVKCHPLALNFKVQVCPSPVIINNYINILYAEMGWATFDPQLCCQQKSNQKSTGQCGSRLRSYRDWC